MGFYGGRPGQSFEIKKVFHSNEEMENDINNSVKPGSTASAMDNYWVNVEVPVNSFVLLSLPDETNSAILIKEWNGEVYSYRQVGVVGGVVPKIVDGYWSLGGEQTSDRAIAREIELRCEFDRQLAVYALLTRHILNETTGEQEIQYGLSNLSEKYIYNELVDSYDRNDEGQFILVYASNSKGEFQHDESGFQIELGYFLLSDWENTQIPETSEFKSNWLQWRYVDTFDDSGEKIWTDLFEITELTNITYYKNEALKAAQEAEDYYYSVKDLSDGVGAAKEEIDKTAETLNNRVSEAEGYAQTSITNYEKTSELIDAIVEWNYGETTVKEEIPPDAIVYNEVADSEGNITYYYKTVKNSAVDPTMLSAAEVIQARNSFPVLGDRLNNMPYQFDTISSMQACVSLSRGDRVFTFGRDNIGDGDSSKLFQIFDPNVKEDKERLEAIKKDSQTKANPAGEKEISEQYPIANGLIAGLLTIFSGTGSGGGPGGSAVPSITVTGTEFSVKEGEIITLEYYWTGPTAGTATLFINDSNKATPKVVDYYDSSKVYSSGVPITTGFGAGKVTLQPAKGEHNYTFYIIDRAQAFSNKETVKVICGGISMTVNLDDGKVFSSNQAIAYNYSVNTIYSKPSVLAYTIYLNNQEFRSGTLESSSSSVGLQSIILNVKSSTENIGQGEFRVSAYAYVKDDPNTVTNTIIRNFVIMEDGVIYLTTSYEDTGEAYEDTPIIVPMQLTYVGGSNFVVEGRYGETEDFVWEDAQPLSTPSVNVDRAGSFTYSFIFTEPKLYYIKFKVSSTSIEAKGESRTISINVQEKESIYPLSRPDILQVHYDAQRGQTNAANKNIWENSSEINSSYEAILNNFNYSSNGWDTIEQEINGNMIKVPNGYLHCSGKAYVTSTYPFFNNITATTGGTFEIVFKAANIGKDQTILAMSYVDSDSAGLFIYKDRVILNVNEWGLSNLTAYYNINGVAESDKPVHISVTLDPPNRYAKIYVNGVLSAASAAFAYQANVVGRVTRTYVNRSISESNPRYGITKVDCMRFYEGVLSPVEILRNYIYNLRDEKQQAELWAKNNLDDNSDDSLPDKIPYMTFYISNRDWQLMDKDNYKPKITVTYHDPNPPEGNKTDYEWKKVRTSWQGTSSIAYPVKNFKIKLPSKYYIRGKGKSLGEKTFCLKADYMDSSHCHNTGNANFIHETGLLTNYSLTPAQSKELNISVKDGYKGLDNLPSTDLEGNELSTVQPDDLKTRTCIYGHPIALYICLETEESEAIPDNPNKEYQSPIFWGIYNFNLDKGSTDSFGLTREDDDFQNVTSFEIAANSAYDGGGFRALRFIKKKNEEAYGWCKWNVGYQYDAAQDSYSINLENGKSIYVVISDKNGTIQTKTKQINFDYNGKNYTGVYSKNNDVKGAFVTNERFNEDGSQNDATGKYIKLFEVNVEEGTLKLDENNDPYLIGLYDFSIQAEWSYDVPYDTSLYDLKENWELYGDYFTEIVKENIPKNGIILEQNDSGYKYIILKEPKDKSYKYEYYEADFELRYPDADIYLLSDGDTHNKLYYKEYDKIIKVIEWVDNVGSEDVFTKEFSEHFDKDTLINYYLMLMVTGLIDNFGKNLMIDTWGYDKNGEVPYEIYEEGGVQYHKVWKYISEWDEEEEYYLDEGTYQYGLMDVTNPVETADGLMYNVYASDEEFSAKGALIGQFPFGGTTDDRQTGWYHETDESKYVWYTHFYDLDSCLGVNNSGELIFSPSMEMNDTSYINLNDEEVHNAPFNTSNSALWQQLVTKFNSDIHDRWPELVTNGIFTIDTFYKFYYENIINIMGERLYNSDANPKYLSRDAIKVIINGQVTERYPYEFDHLALGNDWERLKTWISDRIYYLSTMFDQNEASVSNDAFELRTEDSTHGYNFEIECYKPAYMRIVYQNNSVGVARLRGRNGSFTYGIKASGATDQEVYFMPANNVKSFKEISTPQLGFSSFKLGGATNLLEIDLSNSKGLRDMNLENKGTGTSLLRKINVQNCENLAINIIAQNFPYLEYVNTLGSKATLNFNAEGGMLETALLEAGGSSLKIVDHSDLKDLTIQLSYPDGFPRDLTQGHNGLYNTITFENCSNDNFNFKVIGRYFEASTQVGVESRWTDIGDQTFNTFTKNYGIFSLFSNVTELTIRNSMLNIPDKRQLQPNGSVLYVKELILSLPKLMRLEVIDTQYNKIAIVSATRRIDNQNIAVGYPGWGGTPSVTKAGNTYFFRGDSDYITDKTEGIIGDSNIEELEFRGTYDLTEDKTEESSLPQAGNFQFPWRIYLGSLTGLKRLKFNTSSITAKPVIYDSTGEKGDPYYLTRSTTDTSSGSSWKPCRFELVLPPPPKEDDEFNGLEMIYFGPNVSSIDFTCIRQKDTNIGEYAIEKNTQDIILSYNWPTNAKYFETIKTGKNDTLLGQVYFHPFQGVDLRGYKNLTMNFHGLVNIAGVVGMNALSVKNIVDNMGNNVFQGFFEKCAKLNAFHKTQKESDEVPGSATVEPKPAIYSFETWDFSDWFNQNLGKYFTNINYFFSGCAKLKETKYLEGLLQCSNSGFHVETAKGLFQGCTSLNALDINWSNINSSIYDITDLCSGCTSLEEAKIQISGIETNVEYIRSLENLFLGCERLTDVDVILLTGDIPPKSHFKNIENVQSMFQGCAGLSTIDLTKTFADIGIDSADTYIYSLDSLKNAQECFLECENLESVKFADKTKLTKVTNLVGIFNNCKRLKNIFDNSPENVIQLYNANDSTSDLDLSRSFAGCSSLVSLKSLKYADMTRVTNLNSAFSNCTALGQNIEWESTYETDSALGKLDLSHWNFDITTEGSTRTPNRYVNFRETFFNCSSLTEIIFPYVFVNQFSSLFKNCSNLERFNLSHIIPEESRNEDGSVNGVKDFSGLFSGCSRLTDSSFADLGYQNWNVMNAHNFEGMFQGNNLITQLDLSKWKIYKSTVNVNMADMFNGCSSLINITGLCNIFGTYENVEQKVVGQYNEKIFDPNGVRGLFMGCSSLLLGQNDNYLAPWARMAVNIETVENMFYNCEKLEKLQKVFAITDSEGNIDKNRKPLYWGSIASSGPLSSMSDCRFSSLRNFASMCEGCRNLKTFDYFSANYVAYADTEYNKPTNLHRIIASCPSVTLFSFALGYAGMHRLENVLTQPFIGCSSLITIGFPFAVVASSKVGNLGIKVNIDFSPVSKFINDTLSFTLFLQDLPKWLYNYQERGEIPSGNDYGIISFSKKQLESSVFTPEVRKSITDLGWTIGEAS